MMVPIPTQSLAPLPVPHPDPSVNDALLGSTPAPYHCMRQHAPLIVVHIIVYVALALGLGHGLLSLYASPFKPLSVSSPIKPSIPHPLLIPHTMRHPQQHIGGPFTRGEWDRHPVALVSRTLDGEEPEEDSDVPDILPLVEKSTKRVSKRALFTIVGLTGAGIAIYLPHVQAAVEIAKTVFVGGSDSLLHSGAQAPVSEHQELIINLIAGFFACCVSATITYPIDTAKTRLQAKAYKAKAGAGFLDLYNGLPPSLATVCPSASLFVAMSYMLKRLLLGLPFVNATWTVLASLIAGAVCNAILSLYRVPSDMMIKLIQTDVCATVPQALTRIFKSPGALRILMAVWAINLYKTIPYGALKIGVYEGYEILLGSVLARWGFSKFCKSMLCGAVSGVTTGLLTTPIDVVMTRLMTQVHDMTDLAAAKLKVESTDPSEPHEPVVISSVTLLKRICAEIYEEYGIRGFFIGALYRACYYAPSSCSFFAVFELLRVVLTRSLSPVPL